MKILRDLRDRSGLTLRQVEEATDISNAYLSQLENGKIKHPSATILYKLSKLYSTNIEDLLIAAGMIKDEERVIPVQLKESIEERLEKLHEALEELMKLKEWKDKHGKDEHYKKHQPAAWDKARTALDLSGR